MRRTLIAVGIAAMLASTALAAPAQAGAYVDPLTRGDHVVYNHHDYRLSISPVAGAAKVTRFGHRVAATYSVRMIDPRVSGDVVVYSGRLGYSRTAYLRTKTVSRDVERDYGIRTYLKKVTGFSAAYAMKQVAAYTVAYRHRVLRGDVAATAAQVTAYVEEHGSSAGLDTTTVVVKSDGYFGYEDATLAVVLDGATAFAVTGSDPTDGYTVRFESVSGKTTTGLQ